MTPIGDLLNALFTDYTLRTVAAGSAALGAVSGGLGSYAVLRRQSLVGDAISHAALPGIALAFLLTGSKQPIVLVIGAGVAGWLGMLLVIMITRTTRIKQDSALGIVLSVFFGAGLVLLSLIQKMPDAAQAGLDRFLFGQAATLLERDVVTILALGGAAVLVTVLLWKELEVSTFDPDFASTVGVPVRALELVLTALLVVSIVIGLQAVGVVLMSALVVAPAAAARQWTDRLGRMMIVAAAIGAGSGLVGSLVSSSGRGLPTGPLIVIVASAAVVFSLFFGKSRGLAWRWLRYQRSRRALQLDGVLVDLYALSLQHTDPDHGHEAQAIQAMRPRHGGVRKSLAELVERGWVRESGLGYALTTEGRSAAKRASRGENDR